MLVGELPNGDRVTVLRMEKVRAEAQFLPQAVKLSTNAPGNFPIVEGEAQAILGLQSLIEDRSVVIAGHRSGPLPPF